MMSAQRTSGGAAGGAFAWCDPQPATTTASTKRNVTRVGTRADLLPHEPVCARTSPHPGSHTSAELGLTNGLALRGRLRQHVTIWSETRHDLRVACCTYVRGGSALKRV